MAFERLFPASGFPGNKATELIYLEYPQSTDPYFNLAMEQHVFDNLDRSRAYFMLWQNDNSIIVGKNQNTVGEINSSFVKERGIKVARRLSGGGAVYHDLGNLNFTFIVDAEDAAKIDFKLFCEPVANALQSLGVKAEVGGRNDITIDSRKFSGNSQYLRGGRVLHHGTIMFDSDLEVLSQALKVSDDKIVSKGCQSVRSRVTNVREHLAKGTTLEDFKKALLLNILGPSPQRYHLNDRDLEIITALRDGKYATWDWNYGLSPAYGLIKKRRVQGCGSVEVGLEVAKGLISDFRIQGDFFGVKEVDELAKKFIGLKPEAAAYRLLLADIKVGDYIANLEAEQLLEILTD